MTATLLARGLGASHGARTLFTGVDLVVAPGEVVGLTGANGAGKTTLLRLLAGEEAPQEGEVSLTPGQALVVHLEQEVARAASAESVAEHLRRRCGAAAADDALAAGADALERGSPGADDAYATALERWLAAGVADVDERAAAALDEVGLAGVDPATPVAALSGGQAARAGLAALLLVRADVLLLDEPTNDLDLAGLERLEAFVAGQRAGVVVVSHDRAFLAACATSVLELDTAQQRWGHYRGGYEAYLAEREVDRAHARARYEEYASTRQTLVDRARTQRSWMDKGVRSAVAKGDPDKNIRARHRESSEKQAAKAHQTDRRLQRLEEVAEPRKEWQLRYAIASAPRSGRAVASARGAVVVRGALRLGPLDLDVDAGDRIALTGANGAGKTTVLELLLGRLGPDELVAGSAGLGASVALGEVDQARSVLGAGASLADALGAAVPDMASADVRTLLAKFGLRADHVGREVASLSPGERTRAELALLSARAVNLVVLDEPTNHLDTPAIEALEEALEAYDGTLVMVTHDRRTLAAVRTTRRWHVGGGTVTEA